MSEHTITVPNKQNVDETKHVIFDLFHSHFWFLYHLAREAPAKWREGEVAKPDECARPLIAFLLKKEIQLADKFIIACTSETYRKWYNTDPARRHTLLKAGVNVIMDMEVKSQS